MDHDTIQNLEQQFIDNRYSDSSVSRETAQQLVQEVIRCHNKIATLKGEDIPFPDTRNRKPEREDVGFNGPV